MIAAVHPGMWHPGVLAKFIITADHLSGGLPGCRVAVGLVSGWLRDEYDGFGLPWLEHDERYVRTEEFINGLSLHPGSLVGVRNPHHLDM